MRYALEESSFLNMPLGCGQPLEPVLPGSAIMPSDDDAQGVEEYPAQREVFIDITEGLEKERERRQKVVDQDDVHGAATIGCKTGCKTSCFGW